MDFTCKMQFARSTKNTHRFEEVSSGPLDAKIGVLYIQKSAMPTAPAVIEVSVKEVK